MTTQISSSKSSRIAREYRSYVRQAAQAESYRPITVVDGAQAPRPRGDSWHYETRGGTRISHPSAYSKSGWSNMVYCSSTSRVEVGREWLAARCIPVEAMRA